MANFCFFQDSGQDCLDWDPLHNLEWARQTALGAFPKQKYIFEVLSFIVKKFWASTISETFSFIET